MWRKEAEEVKATEARRMQKIKDEAMAAARAHQEAVARGAERKLAAAAAGAQPRMGMAE